VTVVLALIFATQPHVASALPEDSDGESSSITETTGVEITTAEVSDRESRLRSMEDELLKQLSVGAQPSTGDVQAPTLADIKNVSAETGAARRPSQQIQKNSTPPGNESPLPTQTEAENPTRVTLKSEDTIEPTAAGRRPQASSVVRVSASPTPRRKSAPKRHDSTESLSASDLEHRLAITETQLKLLTQELESTKAKLAQSEARVRELSREVEEGSAVTPGEPASANNPQGYASGMSVAKSDGVSRIDTEVARITKNRSPLRVGPGRHESIITHLSRDNVVIIEHRTEGWYRIVTSDGARGWIAGNYLVFDTSLTSDSTVRVGAYEPRLETMAGRY
jgi:hypothetical protein